MSLIYSRIGISRLLGKLELKSLKNLLKFDLSHDFPLMVVTDDNLKRALY